MVDVEKVVKKVARAIVLEASELAETAPESCTPLTFIMNRDDQLAQAAIAAIVPPGHVVVPVEPTEAMIEALAPWPAHWPSDPSHPDYPGFSGAVQADRLAARTKWRATIAAAEEAR